jgi:N-terminal domain on NACHT_NTPase and P-loop NTPases
MAEAITVLGLVSSIIQIVDFSFKVARGLKSLQSGQSEAAQSLQNVRVQLDLLVVAFENIAERNKNARFRGDNPKKIVWDAVEGCRSNIRQLNDILKRMPSEKDGMGDKIRKMVYIVSQGRRVEKVKNSLWENVKSLEICVATRSSTGTH